MPRRPVAAIRQPTSAVRPINMRIPAKKLLFMGQELAQRHEWERSSQPRLAPAPATIPTAASSASLAISIVFTRPSPALHQVEFDWHGFEWIDANDSDNSVLSFISPGARTLKT